MDHGLTWGGRGGSRNGGDNDVKRIQLLPWLLWALVLAPISLEAAREGEEVPEGESASTAPLVTGDEEEPAPYVDDAEPLTDPSALHLLEKKNRYYETGRTKIGEQGGGNFNTKTPLEEYSKKPEKTDGKKDPATSASGWTYAFLLALFAGSVVLWYRTRSMIDWKSLGNKSK